MSARTSAVWPRRPKWRSRSAEIREQLQLTASAGVAPNKFVAKIASDWKKPDGLFVVRPRDVLDFLAPLPVARLPGVGKVMDERLASLGRSEEHTSELQSLMRISYAVFCLKKKNT